MAPELEKLWYQGMGIISKRFALLGSRALRRPWKRRSRLTGQRSCLGYAISNVRP